MTFKVLSFLIVTCIVLPCWTDNSGENNQKAPGKAIKLSGSSLKLSCELSKNTRMQSAHYDPRNVIVTRAQVQGDRAFVALPRYKQGVPFTLGTVNFTESPNRIEPYPCMAMQEENYCQAIQSVVDVFLDVNNTLWALDVGIVKTMEQPIRDCSPKIVLIDTFKNIVEKTIDLSDLVTAESHLQYLVANKGSVYVADAGTQSILVYDAHKDKTYRKVLPNANGALYKVLYIALATQQGTDKLFFTYLSSPRLYSIKNEYLMKEDPNITDGSIVEVGVIPKQMVLLGANGMNSLFFRYVGENDIYEWNSKKTFQSENLHTVYRGGNCRLTMQVLHAEGEIWVLENNFQDFVSERTGCDGALTKLHQILPKKTA